MKGDGSSSSIICFHTTRTKLDPNPIPSIVIPDHDIRPQDILLGNNPQSRRHIGSRAYRTFVKSKAQPYISAKEQKKTLGRPVVVALATESLFQTSGTRMLRKDKDGNWVPDDRPTWYLTTGDRIRYYVGQLRKHSTIEKVCLANYVAEIASFEEAQEHEVSAEKKAELLGRGVTKQTRNRFSSKKRAQTQSTKQNDQRYQRDMVPTGDIDEKKQSPVAAEVVDEVKGERRRFEPIEEPTETIQENGIIDSSQRPSSRPE